MKKTSQRFFTVFFGAGLFSVFRACFFLRFFDATVNVCFPFSAPGPTLFYRFPTVFQLFSDRFGSFSDRFGPFWTKLLKFQILISQGWGTAVADHAHGSGLSGPTAVPRLAPALAHPSPNLQGGV